jgi:hypothetical protein
MWPLVVLALLEHMSWLTALACHPAVGAACVTQARVGRVGWVLQPVCAQWTRRLAVGVYGLVWTSLQRCVGLQPTWPQPQVLSCRCHLLCVCLAGCQPAIRLQGGGGVGGVGSHLHMQAYQHHILLPNLTSSC